MKRIRIAIQLGISLIAFSAYVSAANHCSFAPAVAEVANVPAHSDCPGHDSPAKKGDSSDGITCCKAFPPAVFADAKNLVAFDAQSFALHSCFATALILPEHSQGELLPLELDTGPPPAVSFVELVLQRSILAHAPPSLV